MARKMLRNGWFWCTIVIIFSSVFSSSEAQTRFGIEQSVVYDENVFRNYLEIADVITQTTAFFSHQIPIKSSQLQFHYAGNLNAFNDFNERLFHTHDLGTSAIAPIYKSLTLQAGMQFQLRKNLPEYDIYDAATWLLKTSLSLTPWQNVHFQTGYSFKEKRFQNLEQFNFAEQSASFLARIGLPTRTTIFAQVNFGLKNYLEDQTGETMIITDRVLPHQGMGPGRRHGDAPIVSDTAIVANHLSIPETHQWSLDVKIAQSIFKTTGVSIGYLRRFSPSQDTRYLSGQGYAYSKDDELFDDPFTYASHEWYATVTQILPHNFALAFQVSSADKNYTYPTQTDSVSLAQDYENRSDSQVYLGGSLEKKFALRRFVRGLTINFSYFYLINESNDFYYDSRGSLISVGSSIKF
ncbi:MAG: hypothetical protein ACOY90_10690 [Candidatus Zhuqueibacterota bacterium]